MRQRGTALLLKAVRSPRNRPWLGEQGLAAQREHLSADSRLAATQAPPDSRDHCDVLSPIVAPADCWLLQLAAASNARTTPQLSRQTPDQPLQPNDTPLLHGARHPGAYLAALGFAASAPTEGSDWGPVSAVVDAIDALHSVTGLPWWATFAGSALGESLRLAR